MPGDPNIFPVPSALTGVLNVVFTSLAKWLRDRLDPPRVKVVRSLAQLVGSGSNSAIVWDNPTSGGYQSGGTFWSGGSPSRLTAPIKGVYEVKFNALFDPNGTGIRLVTITRNGIGNVVATLSTPPWVGWYHGGVVAVELEMAVGDYVEGVVHQSSGAALNVTNVYPLWMSMRLVTRTR